MPKLYFEDDRWVVPGQQTRAAVRHDIPSTPTELADWLNNREAKKAGEPQGASETQRAQPPADHDASQQTSPTIDPALVSEWIFDQATPAQVEAVFAALGTRFHEMRRTREQVTRT
jgi:hypothetical protein